MTEGMINYSKIDVRMMEIQLRTKTEIIGSLILKNMQLKREITFLKDNNGSDGGLKPIMELIPELNIGKREEKDGIGLYLLFEHLFLKYKILNEEIEKLENEFKFKLIEEAEYGASLYLNPIEPLTSEELEELNDKIKLIMKEKIKVSSKMVGILLKMNKDGCKYIELK